MSNLDKIITNLALEINPDIYDAVVDGLRRAIAAEIETAVAPWREKARALDATAKDRDYDAFTEGYTEGQKGGRDA